MPASPPPAVSSASEVLQRLLTPRPSSAHSNNETFSFFPSLPASSADEAIAAPLFLTEAAFIFPAPQTPAPIEYARLYAKMTTPDRRLLFGLKRPLDIVGEPLTQPEWLATATQAGLCCSLPMPGKAFVAPIYVFQIIARDFFLLWCYPRTQPHALCFSQLLLRDFRTELFGCPRMPPYLCGIPEACNHTADRAQFSARGMLFLAPLIASR
jgi:hypothetical protein